MNLIFRIIIIFFCLAFVFAFTSVLAEKTFEIRSSGEFAYGKIVSKTIEKHIDTNTLAATVQLADVSGIAVANLIIKKSGAEVDTEGLDRISGDYFNGYYTASVPLAGYADGSYTVDVSTMDFLGNVGTFSNQASFCVGDCGNCDELADGTKICVTITSAGYETEINPFVVPASANAGSTVNLSATLKKVSGGALLSGQTIHFSNDTSSIDIGDSTTSSGVATIPYYIPLLTASGAYTLKANFEGNASNNTLPSSATGSISITGAGNCIKDRDATICVSISQHN